VNVAPVIATAVIVQVKREVLGLDVATNEDSAGGKAFLRSLVVRALRGRRG
jgi:transposase-like protein